MKKTDTKKYERQAAGIAEIAGKKIKEVIVLTAKANKDDFAINSALEAKVRELGLDIGSMQRNDPRALATNCNIAKWRNISTSEYKYMEGVVLCDDNRNGGEGAIVLFE